MANKFGFLNEFLDFALGFPRHLIFTFDSAHNPIDFFISKYISQLAI